METSRKDAGGIRRERRPVGTLQSPDEALATAGAIVGLLYRDRNLLDLAADPSAAEVRALHLRLVLTQVRAWRPIRLVILAFPAKSPSPVKTLGLLPDVGELAGLIHLERLCRRIGAVYPPGARVTVCTDGHVFADLVRVSDPQVDAYRQSVEDLIWTWDLANLEMYGLASAFGPGRAWDDVRTALMAEFGETAGDLRRRLAADPAARAQWSGIHRFVFEDLVALMPGWTRNRARETAKREAYEVVRRSNAFSALVAAAFPDAVRLSIHPQPEASHKIGVKLVPGGDRWATPWHNAPVVGDGRLTLVRRELAVAAGALPAFLEHRGRRLAYLQAPGEAPGSLDVADLWDRGARP